LALLLTFWSVEAFAVADCFLSATSVAFGIYEPALATPNDSSGAVTVVCTHLSGGASQLSYTVTLSTGSSGTYASRELRAGNLALNYNLYSDAARSIVWGDGRPGTSVMSGSVTVGPGVGNGRREDSRVVYGRVPARQDALDGVYSDTIVLTLEF
jgi:spore coat protein U-like protein